MSIKLLFRYKTALVVICLLSLLKISPAQNAGDKTKVEKDPQLVALQNALASKAPEVSKLEDALLLKKIAVVYQLNQAGYTNDNKPDISKCNFTKSVQDTLKYEHIERHYKSFDNKVIYSQFIDSYFKLKLPIASQAIGSLTTPEVLVTLDILNTLKQGLSEAKDMQAQNEKELKAQQNYLLYRFGGMGVLILLSIGGVWFLLNKKIQKIVNKPAEDKSNNNPEKSEKSKPGAYLSNSKVESNELKEVAEQVKQIASIVTQLKNSIENQEVKSAIGKLESKFDKVENAMLKQKPKEKELPAQPTYFTLSAGFIKDNYFEINPSSTLFILMYDARHHTKEMDSRTPEKHLRIEGKFRITDDANTQNWLIKNHLNGALKTYCELEGNLSTTASSIIMIEPGEIVCDAPYKWRLKKPMRVKLV